jgi:hypothetical protein
MLQRTWLSSLKTHFKTQRSKLTSNLAVQEAKVKFASKKVVKRIATDDIETATEAKRCQRLMPVGFIQNNKVTA